MENEEHEFPLQPPTFPKLEFRRTRWIIPMIIIMPLLAKAATNAPDVLAEGPPPWALTAIVWLLTGYYVALRQRPTASITLSQHNIRVQEKGQTVYSNTVAHIDYILREKRRGYPTTYTLVFSDGKGISSFVDDGRLGPDDPAMNVYGRSVPIVDQRPLSLVVQINKAAFEVGGFGLYLAGIFLLRPRIYERLALAFQGRSIWLPMAIEAYLVTAAFVVFMACINNRTQTLIHRTRGDPPLVNVESYIRWFR